MQLRGIAAALGAAVLMAGIGFGITKAAPADGPQARALAAYLAEQPADALSPYVFPSQRSDRLTEAGIHHWFRTLKAHATHTEWPLIAAVAFHDLRHDFAHRARAAGWSLEAVAYYLGHITNKGTPAIQTTARYTQVSRAKVKAQLGKITG